MPCLQNTFPSNLNFVLEFDDPDLAVVTDVAEWVRCG
jgi:hypothetical protein